MMKHANSVEIRITSSQEDIRPPQPSPDITKQRKRDSFLSQETQELEFDKQIRSSNPWDAEEIVNDVTYTLKVSCDDMT